MVQVNSTDIHAGELYMLADDPGEDHNFFKNISDGIMANIASVTDVSYF